MPKTISIELSEELLAKLDRLAAMSGRSRSWLIERILGDNIDYEIADVAEMQAQTEDIRAGRERLIPNEQAMAELDAFLREKIGSEEYDHLLKEEEKEHKRLLAEDDARSAG